MSDKLLPCPFCQGTDLRIEEDDISPVLDKRTIVHLVVCDNVNCNVEGPTDLGKSGAIEKWNAAPRNGWQPIETAPKDGTAILVWPDDYIGEDGCISLVEWKDQMAYYPGCRWQKAWCIVGSGDDQNSSLTADHPTHWLPLPPPPEASK